MFSETVQACARAAMSSSQSLGIRTDRKKSVFVKGLAPCDPLWLASRKKRGNSIAHWGHGILLM